MSLYQPEPVEISTRMRPGEWTEASLEELVSTYQAKILAMGAAVSDVLTDEPEGGGFTNTESTNTQSTNTQSGADTAGA
jgi:hypothetical protein